MQERSAEAPAPWEQMSGDVSDQAHELGRLMREVASAFAQVMQTGSEAQMGEARKVLATARRDLYRILADGDSARTTASAIPWTATPESDLQTMPNEPSPAPTAALTDRRSVNGAPPPDTRSPSP